MILRKIWLYLNLQIYVKTYNQSLTFILFLSTTEQYILRPFILRPFITDLFLSQTFYHRPFITKYKGQFYLH